MEIRELKLGNQFTAKYLHVLLKDTVHKPHNREEWFIFWFDLYTLYLWENGCNLVIPARLCLLLEELTSAVAAPFLKTIIASGMEIISFPDGGNLEVYTIWSLLIFQGPRRKKESFVISSSTINTSGCSFIWSFVCINPVQLWGNLMMVKYWMLNAEIRIWVDGLWMTGSYVVCFRPYTELSIQKEN